MNVYERKRNFHVLVLFSNTYFFIQLVETFLYNGIFLISKFFTFLPLPSTAWHIRCRHSAINEHHKCFYGGKGIYGVQKNL